MIHITPNISRSESQTYRGLYVNRETGVILAATDFTTAELRAIADDLEKREQSDPSPVYQPSTINHQLT